MTYGYARVSSKDQNLERQFAAFSQFGIKKNEIFCDQKSGKNFQRDGYSKLISKLKKTTFWSLKALID